MPVYSDHEISEWARSLELKLNAGSSIDDALRSLFASGLSRFAAAYVVERALATTHTEAKRIVSEMDDGP